MKKCLVFPGQGAQSVGMGKDLYDSNAAARKVFDEVDDALGEKLSDLIFNGPTEELDKTVNVQPAVFATSMAMLKVAEEQGKIELTEFVAGHSLGEYTALCATGAASIFDIAKLLRKRGKLMQSAVPLGQGAVAVIIGDVNISDVCKETIELVGGTVEPANDNSPGQIVISGTTAAVEKAMEIAKEKGAKIVKKLALSVPVHCSLMSPIVDDFKAAVNEIKWVAPKAKFISNKTADVIVDLAEIKESLSFQLTHGVRWRECALKMAELGIEEVIEVGPGNVLTGLVKRTSPNINSYKLEI